MSARVFPSIFLSRSRQTYLRDYESDLGTKCLNSVPFSQHLTKNCCRDCHPPVNSLRFIAVVANVRLFLTPLVNYYLDARLELSMLKFVVLGVASLAFVGTAVAADLPRAQPVAPAAPVGKYPVGKWPVGKSPMGKYPVAAPVVTKG